MSTTAPEVPQAIQQAEQAVESAAPSALKTPVAEVEQALNAFETGEAQKAEDASGQTALTFAQDAPGIAEGVSAVETGNLGLLEHAAPTISKEVKAGYRTTEFWLVVVGTVLTQIGALHLPGKYGDTITTAALIGSYAISRGLAK